MSWDLRKNTACWLNPNRAIEIDLQHSSTKPWLQILDKSRNPELLLAIKPRELDGDTSSAEVPFGEAYVRQSDLIAIYPERAPSRFGYQIDVRMLKDVPLQTIAMEFWLSIQTSLLDSHPQLQLQWTAAQFNSPSKNYWIGGKSKFGLMVHPLDQSDCYLQLSPDGLTMHAFGRFMEKGVIRRMRFRLILTSQSETAAYWDERFAEFSESPLPLTT
jgi:hypothetical protein